MLRVSPVEGKCENRCGRAVTMARATVSKMKEILLNRIYVHDVRHVDDGGEERRGDP